MIVGWFVSMVFIALLVVIFGSDEMTKTEAVVVNISMQVLAVAAGYAFACRQLRQPNS